MPAIADRVKETTTTAGTGAIALGGAATGMRTFASFYAVGQAGITYCETDGTSWEVWEGTLSGATTLTKDTLLASSTGSAISWAAGSKDVFCDIAGVYVDAMNSAPRSITGNKSVPAGRSAVVADPEVVAGAVLEVEALGVLEAA